VSSARWLLLFVAVVLSTHAGAQPLAPPSAAPSAAPSPSAAPPTNPHAANPHAANPHAPKEVPLPEDGAQPAPDLPPGTLVVALRDALEQPLADVSFDLAVLHQSIARGDTKERLTATTDAQGFASFTGLEFGTAHVYRIVAKRGEASFDTGDFNLSDKFGMRAFLHLYESTPDRNDAGILGRSNVSVTLKEDVLVFEYQVSYLNRSPLAWVADERMVMPSGFKAFNSPDGMSPKLIPGDNIVMLQGTVPPGETQIAFRFQVPMETDGTQTVALPMLPNMAAIGLGMEASSKMTVSLDGFPKSERRSDQSGKSFLMTKKQITPEDYVAGRFLTAPSLTVTGLPARPWASFLAAVLALATAGGGIFYLATRNKAPGLTKEGREDLIEARGVLLGEFVELERARAAGTIGPRTYERLRQAMLDALAGILEKLGAARDGGGVRGIHPLAEIPAFEKEEESSDEEPAVRADRPRKRPRRAR
jgi:hypothetical protein